MISGRIEPFSTDRPSAEMSVLCPSLARWRRKTYDGADYWPVPALPRDRLQKVLVRHGLLEK